MSGAGAARVAAGTVGLFALLAGIATARELGIGAQAVVNSDAAAARGDLATATARARDAAEAVAPGSPYPRAGYVRLQAIAQAAEARTDPRAAIGAWGAMRAAATATSGPLVATNQWRALADDGLVHAASAGPAGAAPGEVHANEATLRAALAREDAPPAGLLALLGTGALAFFAGCGRIALGARDFASLRKEKLALVAAFAGAVLYAIACIRA